MCASQSVMYIVDSLLLPPGCPSDADVAGNFTATAPPITGRRSRDYTSMAAAFKHLPKLSMFMKALQATALDTQLAGLPFPVTIFAPNNKVTPHKDGFGGGKR